MGVLGSTPIADEVGLWRVVSKWFCTPAECFRDEHAADTIQRGFHRHAGCCGRSVDAYPLIRRLVATFRVTFRASWGYVRFFMSDSACSMAPRLGMHRVLPVYPAGT